MKPLSLCLFAFIVAGLLTVVPCHSSSQVKDYKGKKGVSAKQDTSRMLPTTVTQLRQLAQGIKPEELLAERHSGPKFTIGEGKFSFYQGDRPVLTDAFGYGSTSELPILIPLARLIQVDNLREFIDQQPEADPEFWKPYFEEIYAILEQKSLATLASKEIDSVELFNRLSSTDSAIGKMLDETAPNKFAESHGVERVKVMRLLFARLKVPVAFTVNPEPATVSVVSETSYLIATSIGEKPRWRTISRSESLAGCYYCIVKWPDSTESPEQRICVDMQNRNIQINK